MAAKTGADAIARQRFARDYRDSLIPYDDLYARRNKTHTFRYLERRGYVDHSYNTPNDRARIREGGDNVATCMMGGSMFFPETERHTMHQSMAMDMERYFKKDRDEDAVPLCINEIVHGRTRVFFELDYCGDLEVEDSVRDRHIRTIFKTVYRYFKRDQNSCRMVMLTCKTRPKVVDEVVGAATVMRIKYKQGVHLVFPDLVVTPEQLMQIAHSVQIALPPGEESVIDTAPIKSGSCNLRAPACYKTIDCYLCSGKKPDIQTCERCNRRGRLIDVYSAYFPSRAWDYKGNPDRGEVLRLKSEYVYMLETCSIAPKNEQTLSMSYRRPDREPEYIPTKLQSTRRGDGSQRTMTYAKDKTFHHAKWKLVDDAAVWKTCLRILVRWHDAYNGTTVGDLVVNADQSVLRMHLKGVGRSFCMLRNRDHQNNRVYFDFVAKHARVYFRCHDEECSHQLKDSTDVSNRMSNSIGLMDMKKLFPGRTGGMDMGAIGGRSRVKIAGVNAPDATTGIKRKSDAPAKVDVRQAYLRATRGPHALKESALERSRRYLEGISMLGKEPAASDSDRGGVKTKRRKHD